MRALARILCNKFDYYAFRITTKSHKSQWVNAGTPSPSFACYFQLCASFRSHRWIQARVTVWKRSIRVKIGDYLLYVTLKFDGWPRKRIGHLCYATSSFVHHFVTISEFKLDLRSRNSQNGTKFALTSVTLTFDLWLWPFCMDITSANGNYFWKFHDDTMTETLWKGITNRHTERRTIFFTIFLSKPKFVQLTDT